MRIKNLTIFAFLAALIIAVPLLASCEAVASYLIYSWIDDQFNNGGDDTTSEDPIILKITADRQEVHINESVVLQVEAKDNQDSAGELEYFWVTSAGTLINPTSSITVWQTPSTPGTATISIIVRDTDQNETSTSVQIEVLQ